MPSYRGVFAAIVVFCSAAFAQTTTPQPIADARTVAAQSVLAMTNGVVISDVTITGKISSIPGSESQTGTGTLQAKGMTDSRIELDVGGTKRTELRQSDGLPAQGAAIDGLGKSTPFVFHNCVTDAVWFFPALTSLAQSSNAAFVFNDLGKEVHAGIQVRHLQLLQVTPDKNAFIAKLSATDFYLDPQTYLPVAMAFKSHPDDDMNTDIQMEIRFSDYRLVDGVRIPFHVQRLLNGGTVLDLQVTSAVLNSGLPDSLFDVSLAVGGGNEAQ